LGVVFVNGDVFGDAVGGAGGGEDEFADVGREHGFEEDEGGDEVVFVVFEGGGDGFADVAVGGEVHDELDFFLFEDGAEGGGVVEAHFIKGDVGRDSGAVAVDEVVEDDRAVAESDELADTVAADITGSAGDEDVHSKKFE
jgi:hypothetical protein